MRATAGGPGGEPADLLVVISSIESAPAIMPKPRDLHPRVHSTRLLDRFSCSRRAFGLYDSQLNATTPVDPGQGMMLVR